MYSHPWSGTVHHPDGSRDVRYRDSARYADGSGSAEGVQYCGRPRYPDDRPYQGVGRRPDNDGYFKSYPYQDNSQNQHDNPYFDHHWQPCQEVCQGPPQHAHQPPLQQVHQKPHQHIHQTIFPMHKVNCRKELVILVCDEDSSTNADDESEPGVEEAIRRKKPSPNRMMTEIERINARAEELAEKKRVEEQRLEAEQIEHINARAEELAEKKRADKQRLEAEQMERINTRAEELAEKKRAEEKEREEKEKEEKEKEEKEREEKEKEEKEKQENEKEEQRKKERKELEDFYNAEKEKALAELRASIQKAQEEKEKAAKAELECQVQIQLDMEEVIRKAILDGREAERKDNADRMRAQQEKIEADRVEEARVEALAKQQADKLYQEQLMREAAERELAEMEIQRKEKAEAMKIFIMDTKKTISELEKRIALSKAAAAKAPKEKGTRSKTATLRKTAVDEKLEEREERLARMKVELAKVSQEYNLGSEEALPEEQASSEGDADVESLGVEVSGGLRACKGAVEPYKQARTPKDGKLDRSSTRKARGGESHGNHGRVRSKKKDVSKRQKPALGVLDALGWFGGESYLSK